MRLLALDSDVKKNPAGIGLYIQNLIPALKRARADLEISAAPTINSPLAPRRGRQALEFLVKTPLFARREKPPLIFGPKPRIPFFLPRRSVIVVTIHDLCHLKAPQTMRRLHRIANSILIPIAMKKATLIIAISKNTAKEIAENYPDCARKIRVAHLGSRFEPLSASAERKLTERSHILFVGTIEPRKNLNRLIEAYARLDSRLKERFPLLIVGEYGWKTRLDGQIERLGLKKNVILKSYAPDHELIELYKTARALVMPSLYEGFGMPILEAQTFGLPVITSNNSSMIEVAGDGAILVDPYSTESISAAIERILTDRGLWEDLSRKSKFNAKKFSWANCATETLKIFDEALAIAPTDRVE